MNPHRIPFLRLLPPFVLGIWMAPALLPHWPWWAALLALSLGAGLFLAQAKLAWRYMPHSGWPFLLALWCFGLLWRPLYEGHFSPRHISHAPDSSYAAYVGSIADVPKLGERHLRTPLRLEALLDSTGQARPAEGFAMLFIERHPAAVDLRYGERIVVWGNLERPKPPRNPGDFDYGRYLAQQRTYHLAYPKKDEWERLPGGQGHWLWDMAQHWRASSLFALREHIFQQEAREVALALVLGYKDELNDELSLSYARTGAMHVLAVSGLHVGIVFMIISQLLQWLPLGRSRRWLSPVLGLAGIWAFALVTGAAPSVLRASTMFSFLIVGKAMGRHGNVYNNLLASAFVLLCANPLLIYSVGFQLSYLAVLGIVFFQPLIFRSFYVKPRWLRWVWELMSVSIAAQLMTLPLGLYYFQQFPTYFWLSGLIVVPLAAFVLGLGLLIIALHGLWAFGASAVGIVLTALLWGMNGSIHAIARFPGAIVDGLALHPAQLWLGLAFLAVLMAFFTFYKKMWWWASLGLLAILLGSFAWQAYERHDSLKISILHQYAATHLRLDDGRRAYGLSLSADGLPNKVPRALAEAEALPDSLEQGRLLRQGPLLQIGQQRLCIVAGKTPPLPCDIVLVHGRQADRPEAWLAASPKALVVLDGSVPFWKKQQWREAAAAAGAALHDTYEQGAYLRRWRE